MSCCKIKYILLLGGRGVSDRFLTIGAAAINPCIHIVVRSSLNRINSQSNWIDKSILRVIQLIYFFRKDLSFNRIKFNMG